MADGRFRPDRSITLGSYFSCSLCPDVQSMELTPESSATRKLARNGLGGDNGDLLEADFWGVRRSHRNKGVSQAGI